MNEANFFGYWPAELISARYAPVPKSPGNCPKLDKICASRSSTLEGFFARPPRVFWTQRERFEFVQNWTKNGNHSRDACRSRCGPGVMAFPRGMAQPSRSGRNRARHEERGDRPRPRQGPGNAKTSGPCFFHAAMALRGFSEKDDNRLAGPTVSIPHAGSDGRGIDFVRLARRCRNVGEKISHAVP